MHSKRFLLTAVVLLSFCGCKNSSSDDERRAAPAPDATVPSSAAESSPASAPPPPPPQEEIVDFSATTFEELKNLDHRILTPHAVAVDVHPYCEPALQPPGSTERNEKRLPWPVRESAYDPLRQRFSTHPAYVSVIVEDKRRKIVLLFEPSFTDWESIQSQIPLPRKVPVELRPACHTSKQKEAARVIADRLIADPTLPGIFDRQQEHGINGYRVYVLPAHEREAEVVKERLGSIANVWFTPYFKIVTHGAEAPAPR